MGRKCTLFCNLINVNVEVLWDIGAQVSVVSKEFIEQHFPWLYTFRLEDKANGTKLPLMGLVDLEFKLNTGNTKTHNLNVPFLVSKYFIDLPIIGYNEIEQIVTGSNQDGTINLNSILSANLNKEASVNTDAIINFIKSTH